MLKLSRKLVLDTAVMLSPNLTNVFAPEDLSALGEWVMQGYLADEASRAVWKKRTQAAMDLAMQLQKDKSFPWPNCSNIAFPLITIGAMQFHARAYPEIVKGPDIVKCRVLGEDETGEERERADRIQAHMSWQLLEEDLSWEEEQDRLLLIVPIVGCAFKKTYYSEKLRRNVSEMVMPQDLALNYHAPSVESCERKSQLISCSRNDMHSAMVSGVFHDYREADWFRAAAVPFRTPEQEREDARKGLRPPSSDEATPFLTLEQHVGIDLDQDGYAEPYIVTVETTSRKVLRIVARWDSEAAVVRSPKGEVIQIIATEYYTKYGFIPSPDKGIYDIGFGVLLGPLNETTNSLINQLVDAGTMSTSAGGFLARGAKMRGGSYTFAPLEWKRVEASGEDLRKSVFPLPVREPSMVLFQLLSLVINYTNRISGSTDTMVGENPGQNTPAANMTEMVTQGQKIFTSIYKRIWRASKREFAKLYELNRVFLPAVKKFGANGARILRDDYQGTSERIVPAADPQIVSEAQRLQRIVAIKQSAASVPGYDIEAVERRFLREMQVEGASQLYPGIGKMPPPANPKIEVEKMRMQVRQAELDLERQTFILQLMEDRRLNNAKILELQAKASLEVETAGGVQQGHQIAAFQAALGAMKQHDEALRGRIDMLLKAAEADRQYELDRQGSGSMAELAAAPSDSAAAPLLGGG